MPFHSWERRLTFFLLPEAPRQALYRPTLPPAFDGYWRLYFPVIIRQKPEVDNSSPSSGEVKNAMSYVTPVSRMSLWRGNSAHDTFSLACIYYLIIMNT